MTRDTGVGGGTGTVEARTLAVPELSLVVLIGASGSGKTTFAARHFAATEILSSDACRGMVSDDENDQSATKDAFALLHTIARTRLARRRLVVVDATNVRPEDRRTLVQIAREFHAVPVAIVFDLPAQVCKERTRARPDRNFGPHVIGRQRALIKRTARGSKALQREGFRYVHTLRSADDVDAVTIDRQKLWTDRRDEQGPFDIIGDVHGCFAELSKLLNELGYTIGSEQTADGDHRYVVSQPLDERGTPRRVVFLGDLVDRGPSSPDVLRLAMDMVAAGSAICVPGNHDVRLLRKLRGKDVRLTHGLAETLQQMEDEPDGFADRVRAFLDSLVSHFVLDDGRLVVAHAGMKDELAGRASGVVRDFALYGETTGETDEYGLPVRHDWAASYRGEAMVCYGHTPVPEPEWLNRTVCLDTGCVFGGSLTALRYPEREFVRVPAERVYCEPVRPLPVNEMLKAAAATGEPGSDADGALSAQQEHDTLLDLDDVVGGRIIRTGLGQNVTIRAENAAAALEVMNRFAADPRWLIYLPPTMSPCETSQREDVLEYPAEAFDYYRYRGVPRVICQQKHMGSRAVLVVCRDADAARTRFGVDDGSIGVCVTRTGRPFFRDDDLQSALLAHVRDAVTAAGLWDELATGWLLLDAELMPWSAKAQGLLRDQYAAVGSAATSMLETAGAWLQQAADAGRDVATLQAEVTRRSAMTAAYEQAYRGYCWPVAELGDYRLAPFHLLASESGVHVDRDHRWHMQMLARLAAADDSGLLMATGHREIDVTDSASRDAGTEWWQQLTDAGGEGMVVKPLDFVSGGSRGIVQPALKVRGREYLRIIYGPEYTAPDQLPRLRARSLKHKRSMAFREFALGVEALHRFVRREPLRRVHECVAGVLALESEPVDPRL